MTEQSEEDLRRIARFERIRDLAMLGVEMLPGLYYASYVPDNIEGIQLDTIMDLPAGLATLVIIRTVGPIPVELIELDTAGRINEARYLDLDEVQEAFESGTVHEIPEEIGSNVLGITASIQAELQRKRDENERPLILSYLQIWAPRKEEFLEMDRLLGVVVPERDRIASSIVFPPAG